MLCRFPDRNVYYMCCAIFQVCTEDWVGGLQTITLSRTTSISASGVADPYSRVLYFGVRTEKYGVDGDNNTHPGFPFHEGMAFSESMILTARLTILKLSTANEENPHGLFSPYHSQLHPSSVVTRTNKVRSFLATKIPQLCDRRWIQKRSQTKGHEKYPS